MLLTTGERVSAALLTMALADLGIPAVSFTGSQVGIITDTVHGKAKIVEVKGDRVRDALAGGKVAVVAGFQGVSTEREITTMGRGASDLTASALAKALGAEACEIYTDVTGVFSADPRDRAARPQAATCQLRRDAGDGRRRLQGARPALGRVRPQPRCAAARALGVHVGAGHVDHRRAGHRQPQGGSDGRPDHLRRRHRLERVQGHRARRARPARRLGVAVRTARRRQRQRRHDRPEHVDRGQDGHQLHDAVGRHGRRRGHRQPRRRGDRCQRRHPRQRHRQGVRRRCRHEVVAGDRRQDVPHARRRGRQHRDDLDVDDPHLRRRRQRRPRAGGAHTAHGVRPRHRQPTTPPRSPSVADTGRRRLHSRPVQQGGCA